MSKGEATLKCGACGKIGKEEEFKNEVGKQSCTWCDSDIWLDTLEEHEGANG